jgi:hypothetical protein
MQRLCRLDFKGTAARTGGHCGFSSLLSSFLLHQPALRGLFDVQPMHHLLSHFIFPLQGVFPRSRDLSGTDFALVPASDAEA